MTGIELAFRADDPKCSRGRLRPLEEGDEQHFRNGDIGIGDPRIKPLCMRHEDRRSLIEAHATGTKVPRSRGASESSEATRQVVPTKDSGGPRLGLVKTDTGRISF